MSRGQLPSGNIMYIVGIVVIAAVALYTAFMGIDGWGLAEEDGSARVTGKEYIEAGSTYMTQVIGGRSFVTSQDRPELWVIELELDGEPTAAAVERAVYESLSVGDEVRVTYSKRRLTGALQVLSVDG